MQDRSRSRSEKKNTPVIREIGVTATPPPPPAFIFALIEIPAAGDERIGRIVVYAAIVPENCRDHVRSRTAVQRGEKGGDAGPVQEGGGATGN